MGIIYKTINIKIYYKNTYVNNNYCQMLTEKQYEAVTKNMHPGA